MSASPSSSQSVDSERPSQQHRLSAVLEKEIQDDERAIERFGGDYPPDPPPHPSSARPSTDDRTAVNSIHEEHKKVESRIPSPIPQESEGSADEDNDRVDWDGPNDPANPQNWSFSKKMMITLATIIITLNVTFASSSPSTAILAIADEFHVSEEVSILVVSLFLVGYIFGPIMWSGFSEVFGRRPVFLATAFAYTVFTLGQAKANSITTLLVTRFFAGLFASTPLTNGGGVLADIWDAVGRGPAVAVFVAAVFIGPIAGPIVGAFVVESSLGWRWIFWIMMIMAGVCFFVIYFMMPETFAPVLLQEKAKRLRKEDPIRNANKKADLELQDWSIMGVIHRTIFRPFTMLVLEPILVLITIYLCMVYGLIYALFEVFPIIFVEMRGISPRLSGLTFIGVGIGTTIGSYIFYWHATRVYGPIAKKWRGFPPAESRLPVAMIGGPLLVVAILWVSWTGAYPSVPWYVPEIGAIPLGCAIALVFISFQSYMVDTYLMYSASALAANSILRSAAGAAFPLFTRQMFNTLGVQWAGTLLAGIALILAPSPFVFYRYGAWIRTKSRFAPCIDLKIKDEIEQEEREEKEKLGEKGKSAETAV